MSLTLPVLGAVAGMLIGSFLATLIVRWPRGEQVVGGRSKCDSCGRTLRPYELIPIMSAIAAGGFCRSCGARIPRLHSSIEIASAVLAFIALLIHPGWDGAALGTFWLLLLAPAVLDFRHFWLPDRLTLLLGATGLALGGLALETSLLDRVIGGLTGFAALWIVGTIYVRVRGRSGLGAGDPKFLGAIGLWTGWQALPFIVTIAAMTGLALAIALGRSRLDRLPFGTLLATGAIIWTAVQTTLTQPINF